MLAVSRGQCTVGVLRCQALHSLTQKRNCVKMISIILSSTPLPTYMIQYLTIFSRCPRARFLADGLIDTCSSLFPTPYYNSVGAIFKNATYIFVNHFLSLNLSFSNFQFQNRMFRTMAQNVNRVIRTSYSSYLYIHS